jgi:hypothetical protein
LSVLATLIAAASCHQNSETIGYTQNANASPALQPFLSRRCRSVANLDDFTIFIRGEAALLPASLSMAGEFSYDEGVRDMRRREFVKAMIAASVSARTMMGQKAPASVAPSAPLPIPPKAAPLPAPGPVPWMRGLLEAKPLPMTPLVPDAVAHTKTYFFTRQQLATLRQLCEVLMPPLKSAPGAIDAGAPEFLDFLISVSPADQQQLYVDGLERMDAEARRQFGLPFAGVNLQQADALIRPWLRTWMTDHPPNDPHERFINLAHSDIRTATINSKPWSDALPADDDARMEEGLYWYPVDPDLDRSRSRKR